MALFGSRKRKQDCLASQSHDAFRVVKNENQVVWFSDRENVNKPGPLVSQEVAELSVGENEIKLGVYSSQRHVFQVAKTSLPSSFAKAWYFFAWRQQACRLASQSCGVFWVAKAKTSMWFSFAKLCFFFGWRIQKTSLSSFAKPWCFSGRQNENKLAA